MSTTPNPYATDLGGRDAIEALDDTPARIAGAVSGWTSAQFERTYAPGKWTIRQILCHLAQAELALGTRVRFALTEADYVAQPFAQDEWLRLDGSLDGPTALAVYTTLRVMNLAMFRALSPDQFDREFSHPEYGALAVRWVANQMAGHDIHHLKQIGSIAASDTPPARG